MKIQRFCVILIAILSLAILTGCTGSGGKTDRQTGAGVESPGPAETIPTTGSAAEEQMRQAALDGELEKVKALLDAGTAVNAIDQEGHTALMFAAFNGHSEILLALIKGGASVDRRDLLGRTALLYASTGPFPETVKILLDKGAEPNIVDSEEHFSPLMHASAEGNFEVVKILLEFDADPSLTDVDGDDAESFARQSEHTAVADYLKEGHKN
ncbi:MAG: ankyrin repeat domain-containing protein [Bacteroidales bacterium]|nr:ankyrin repeat domain-containing protein [Bacteroidales bacterium]